MNATSELEAVLLLAAGHDVTVARPSGPVTIAHSGAVEDDDHTGEDYRHALALYSAAIKLGQLLAVVPPGVVEQWGGRQRLAGALIMIHKAESYLPAPT